MAVADLRDQGGEASGAGSQHASWVPIALQHRDVGVSELPGHRLIEHRHDVAGQFPDPGLLRTGQIPEAIRGPHPPIQRRPWPLGQLDRQQPVVDQRQLRQRLGVDQVRLGVTGPELPQRRRLRCRHPIHEMPATHEEHRHRQPRRSRRLEHHLQARPLRGVLQRGALEGLQSLDAPDAPGSRHDLTCLHRGRRPCARSRHPDRSLPADEPSWSPFPYPDAG